ncbi:MAG: phage terminase small subunit P27 family [Acetobacter sp.]|uniref:phage terminase small subunit P27 family n=1 Tax=Acetobacter sp. TaxID=440 RepID=UPI003F8F4E59
MVRGRTPNSPELNEARGNPGKRPKKERVLDLSPIAGIDAPKHMRANARKYWADVAGYITDSRIVRVSDRNMLARYCETLADYVKVTGSLGKQGHVYWTESAHGKMQRISPFFLVQERLVKRLQDMEDRLGLNPASRQQILLRMAANNAQPTLALTQPNNDDTSADAVAAPGTPPLSSDPLDFFAPAADTRH